MITYKDMGIFPARFETQEDAMLYLNCVASRKKFPQDKWIYPFEYKNGMVVTSQRYRDANFEQRFVYSKPLTIPHTYA